MAGNTIGTLFRVTTFGESHGPAIGVVVDGTPPRLDIDREFIQKELDRRKPGQSEVTTSRGEADSVEILSGVFQGKSTGVPIAMIIQNRDAQSSAYDNLKDIFRPGHGDYTYFKKYGIRDHRGSGRYSGRETAARVAAGAIGKLILKQYGISIRAYTLAAAGIKCIERNFNEIENNSIRACDAGAAKKIEAKIIELAARGDSAGGIVECSVRGVPAGLGEPVFSKLDAELAKAVVSLGAVKGIEFGGGFSCAEATGSSWNDEMDADSFLSNNAGGIISGISSGEEILFRAAVKPTPSIAMRQKTRNLKGEQTDIEIEGRHDPCICPRIVPVIEAMTSLVLTDMVLRQKAIQ